MTTLFLSLDRIRLLSDPEDNLEIACPVCSVSLAVHQPDAERPERLLGTCASCSAWYLIRTEAAVMVRLPDEDDWLDT
jgi:uncharacterized protein YbaR (Trm112 family)